VLVGTVLFIHHTPKTPDLALAPAGLDRPTVEELRQDLRAMIKKCRKDFDPQA
jgi:hypothetical protein